LAARKQQLFAEQVARHGVTAYPSTVALLRRLSAEGVPAGLVTASRNSETILAAEADSPNNYRLSKQADVLMLFYLLSAEELRATLPRSRSVSRTNAPSCGRVTYAGSRCGPPARAMCLPLGRR
jgi:hypothetical protein